MFTGIIEELGEVVGIRRIGRGALLQLRKGRSFDEVMTGESIAVNGVCLTVSRIQKDVLYFDVIAQTLTQTNLGRLQIRDKVNLERALKVGDRISGHFVYGHIDYIGIIRKKNFIENNLCFEIALKPEFISNIVLRGSVAVDGISLTVQKIKRDSFSVYIIPHTAKSTTLGFKVQGSSVNIEFDKLYGRVKDNRDIL
ncbi:MAG: riboflavin synthase [Candidatus Omnitrophica bacterium]|nr:riboflavin synthase [Candidatus Omnitrophota bacterium]